MHIADPATGNLGANAIVCGSAGIATGAGFAAKRLGNGDRVAGGWRAGGGEGGAWGRDSSGADNRVDCEAGGDSSGGGRASDVRKEISRAAGHGIIWEHRVIWASEAHTVLGTTPQEIRISPKARRLAKERGVDLAQLRGSGPGGEILAADVETALISQLSALRCMRLADRVSRGQECPRHTVTRHMGLVRLRG
jgi:e3 binding domain